MELPRLERLYRNLQKEGLSVIAVEKSRDTVRAREFVRSAGLGFHLVEDGDGDAAVAHRVFRVSGVPASFLVDREGRVNYAHVGFQAGDEVLYERELRELLSRPKTPSAP